MKKLFIMLAAMIGAATSQAQTPGEAAGDKPEVKTESTPTEEHKGWYNNGGSMSFNYLGRFESAAAINYDWRIKCVNVGVNYTVSGGDGWGAYAGLGTRYYLDPSVFIDGAAGMIFGHSSYEYRVSKYETKKESSNSFGLYVLPRISLIVFKGVGINIGYMMAAPKMKFDGFFENGSVMLGICIDA